MAVQQWERDPIWLLCRKSPVTLCEEGPWGVKSDSRGRGWSLNTSSPASLQSVPQATKEILGKEGATLHHPQSLLKRIKAACDEMPSSEAVGSQDGQRRNGLLSALLSCSWLSCRPQELQLLQAASPTAAVPGLAKLPTSFFSLMRCM